MDEILDLIESLSEGFSTYSLVLDQGVGCDKKLTRIISNTLIYIKVNSLNTFPIYLHFKSSTLFTFELVLSLTTVISN